MYIICVCGQFNLQEAVCADNIPGYDHVDRLAAYLIGLRFKSVLTNEEAGMVINLWRALHPHDKARIIYPQRHRDKLLQGRFKSPNRRTNVMPGVESTTRLVFEKLC